MGPAGKKWLSINLGLKTSMVILVMKVLNRSCEIEKVINYKKLKQTTLFSSYELLMVYICIFHT